MKALAPSARALRLAAIALLGGAAAGLAAAGDIKASYREGRIASPWSAAYAATPTAPKVLPQAEPQDPALAHAHGFALAAQRGIARPADCRSVSPEFRTGCEDYATSRAAPRAEADLIG
ncbi:MAG TPA: hypothetical protein VEZ20_06475 [Allosphingosinicella sp.]|jgi:hypothetical protein|nr:hypothetical protein [Allosphingosinicella sp.]